MRAFLGIIYVAGVLKSGRLHISEMFDNSKGTGVELMYLTMTAQRFRFLLRALRFDNIETRSERQNLDKLAPIREIFELVTDRFKENYTPSEFLTLDEQLVAFRGKCPFRQYIPSKPAKYGIKIYALVDAKSIYTFSTEIYAGKQPQGSYYKSNASKDVALRLVSSIEGLQGRNITMDNYFTSIPLAEDLLKKKISIIGTLRKNKREIPIELIQVKQRAPGSSMFAFKKGMTLVSYVPKKNRVVLALSTMHEDDSIDVTTEKPEIITAYNNTKCGVDLLDRSCPSFFFFFC